MVLNYILVGCPWFHTDSVHGRNVVMTKWGVDNLGLLANCNDCESTFSDLNEVLYISALENWLKTIVTDKKHERDRFRSDLVASYDIESNSCFLTMIWLDYSPNTGQQTDRRPSNLVKTSTRTRSWPLTILLCSLFQISRLPSSSARFTRGCVFNSCRLCFP